MRYPPSPVISASDYMEVLEAQHLVAAQPKFAAIDFFIVGAEVPSRMLDVAWRTGEARDRVLHAQLPEVGVGYRNDCLAGGVLRVLEDVGDVQNRTSS